MTLCSGCGFETGGTLCTCPKRQEIPAGKVLLGEYRDVNESNRARCRVLNEAPGTALHRAPTVVLWGSSPGFEPAGSMVRWTNGFYAVTWDQDGARHGQRYGATDEGLHKARERFAHLTTQEGASDHV